MKPDISANRLYWGDHKAIIMKKPEAEAELCPGDQLLTSTGNCFAVKEYSPDYWELEPVPAGERKQTVRKIVGWANSNFMGGIQELSPADRITMARKFGLA